MEIDLALIKDTSPQREHGDISELKESIRRLGLIQPLVVTPDYSLVAGRRRYQALRELDAPAVAVHVVSPKDDYIKFLMALDENLKRKEMTWQEIALCELEEKRIYEECYPQTKAGQAQALAANKKQGHDVGADSAPTYTAAKAKATGVSERKIQASIFLAKQLN